MLRLRPAALLLLAVSAALGQTSAPLAFTPVVAEYSSALDRIVMVSQSPNQLHIYDPVTRTDATVSLAAAPLALSISPDGRFAAVGHRRLITYVNLTNAAVVRTSNTAFDVTTLALAADYIYILPTMSLRLSDGAVTGALAENATPTCGRLGPDGALYGRARWAVEGPTIGAPQPRINPEGSCALIFSDGRAYDSSGIGSKVGSGAYSAWLEFGPGGYSYAALASHPTQGIAGVVRQSVPLNNDPDVRVEARNRVDLYTGRYPAFRRGSLSPTITVPGGSTEELFGRMLFFNNAGDSLFIIHGGTVNAVLTVKLPSASSPCQVSVSGPTAEVIALSTRSQATISANGLEAPSTGGYVSVPVTSDRSCSFEAQPSVDWLIPRFPIGGGGAGNMAFLVRPNPGPASRTGSIAMGTLTLTVTQPAPDSATAAAIPYPLGFSVQKFEYSRAINRLILVSHYPHELHLYDPVTRTDSIVPLPFPPTQLVRSPDGRTVGLSGRGMAVFVNLNTKSVTPVYESGTDKPVALLMDSGLAYFATYGLPAMAIDSGVVGPAGPSQMVLGFSPGRLVPPANRYAYVGGGGPDPGLAKWDLGVAGTSAQLTPPKAVCSIVWLSEDGGRLFSGCDGVVYRTSDVLVADLLEEGSLGLAPFWVDHSSAIATAAAVTNSKLELFGDEGLSRQGTLTLQSPGAVQPSLVAWNAGADRLSILWTESTAPMAMEATGAVETISAGPGCAAASGRGSASYGGTGGAGTIAVAATCAWKATPSAGWITITSGGFGLGASSLRYAVARNTTGAARTGTISFGDRFFSVTQGADGSVSLPVTSAAFAASGGTGTITVNATPASTAWTAVSSAEWIRIDSGAAGTGNGSVAYTVLANTAIGGRSGTINIGGAIFRVNQGSAAGGFVDARPEAIDAPSEGGQFSVDIFSRGSWVAVPGQSWIRITQPAGSAGSGSTKLSFTVEANPVGQARTGTIAINGSTVTVRQRALWRLTFEPPALALRGAAASGLVRVQSTDATSSWTAVSSAAWLQVNGSAAGSGSFSYSATANTSNETRTATVTFPPTAFSFTVTQLGETPFSTAGLHFVPVAPCRIVDTREAGRPAGFGAPALAGGVERSIAVSSASGGCGVPATAKAYSMNVTVVPKRPLGYLTIWPTGRYQPFVSTLNSVDGRVKANAAIVPAGTDGAVSVMATDATELVLDINGYFVEPGVSAAALAFYPVTPCRIADTRTANGALGGPVIEAGGTRSFPVQAANCGIPAAAQAYSMNATVVPAGPLGYLTMWPTGRAQPLASTLNAPTGAVVANAAIVPAGTNGEVSVFAQGRTHVVLDINGYFAPPGLPNGLRYYPVSPCRLADTREGNGELGGPILEAAATRSFPAGSANCGLPPTARAYALNATAVPVTVLGYLTLWASGQVQPFVSTLNVTDDRIVANAAIVQAGANGGVSSFVTHQTHLVLDTTGYFAP